MVANDDPFHVTVVALEKPPPLTRRVNCPAPAAVVFGERLVRVNGGMPTVNVAALELRPPVCAVIKTVAGCAIRLAGTVAVSCPLFATVVVSAVAFQNATVPAG